MRPCTAGCGGRLHGSGIGGSKSGSAEKANCNGTEERALTGIGEEKFNVLKEGQHGQADRDELNRKTKQLKP